MSQRPASFNKEVTRTLACDYLEYLPEGYENSKADWPLILFLHGKSERGSNVRRVKLHGLPRLIAGRRQFPFVIVSPQCPQDGYWSNDLQIDTLDALLDHVVSQRRIDEERIYVTGMSMGGFGTWRLAIEYPDRFAAIAPVCGGGHAHKVACITHLPVWAFHGAKDDVVPFARSEEMVNALKQAGGNVKFTVYPDADHDAWTETYNNPEFYEWFLKHKAANTVTKKQV